MRCRNRGWLVDPTTAIAATTTVCDGGALLGCCQLMCERCGSAVLHHDGLALERDVDDPLDPLAWLAAGEHDPSARSYACRCQHATTRGAVEVSHLDRQHIDTWTCATWRDLVVVRPAMLPLLDAIRARLTPGTWFALDRAVFEVVDAQTVRSHTWDGGVPTLTTTTFVDTLTERAQRFVARQLALPRDGNSLGVLVEHWVHGDLDSQQLVETYRDVPALLAGLRAHASRADSENAVMPALRSARGYCTLAEY